MYGRAGAAGLVAGARFPLDKRPLQVFNLNLALAAAQDAGIDLMVREPLLAACFAI